MNCRKIKAFLCCSLLLANCIAYAKNDYNKNIFKCSLDDIDHKFIGLNFSIIQNEIKFKSHQYYAKFVPHIISGVNVFVGAGFEKYNTSIDLSIGFRNLKYKQKTNLDNYIHNYKYSSSKTTYTNDAGNIVSETSTSATDLIESTHIKGFRSIFPIMLNSYYDFLVLEKVPVKFFIGSGIGCSVVYQKLKEIKTTREKTTTTEQLNNNPSIINTIYSSPQTSVVSSNKSTYNMALAIHLGMKYEINSKFSFNIRSSYLSAGKAKVSKRLAGYDIKKNNNLLELTVGIIYKL